MICIYFLLVTFGGLQALGEDSLLLGWVARKQGLAHAHRFVNLKRRNTMEGVTLLLEEDVNYPFLVNNSAISSLLCCFITDLVLYWRRVLRARGCLEEGMGLGVGRAALQALSRRQPGLEAH